MIKVPIEYSSDVEEYIMFDMQGQLEHSLDNINCVPLGELEKINDKEYKLIIGIHDIVGSSFLSHIRNQADFGSALYDHPNCSILGPNYTIA
jgi:hypothetical protein